MSRIVNGPGGSHVVSCMVAGGDEVRRLLPLACRDLARTHTRVPTHPYRVARPICSRCGQQDRHVDAVTLICGDSRACAARAHDWR